MKFQRYLHHILLIQTLPGAMKSLDPAPNRTRYPGWQRGSARERAAVNLE